MSRVILKPNRPVTTQTPTVVIDQPLEPGPYRIRLVVVGESGKRSRPTDVTVIVLPRER